MYYGIIFIIISFFAVYTFFNPDTKFFRIMKWVAFFLLFLTSGLRYETAVDYYAYERKFENTEDITKIFQNNIVEFFFKNPSEPGYTILNSIVKTFTDNVNVLFVIISLFTTLLLFKSLLLYNSKKFFFISVLLYYVLVFFILDMSGVRQCIALSIILFSLKYLLNKNYLKYLILVFISVMFHFSALVFFIFPLFMNRNFNKYFVLVIITIGLFVFILRVHWLKTILESLESILSDNIIFAKAYSYTTKTGVFAQERPIFIMLFVNLFLYLLLLFKNESFLKKTNYNLLFFNFFTLFMLATLFLWEIAEFGIRYGLYFSIGPIICLPQLIKFFKRLSRPIVLSFIIFYSFLNARQFIMEHRSVIPYNPYQNYLVHKVLDKPSTGKERLNIYLSELE